MTQTRKLHPGPSSAVFAAALLAVSAPQAATAAPQGADARREAVKLEVRYVNLLNEAGLAEYADFVLKDVQAKYPEAKAVLKTAALEQTLRLGRFDEAKKAIAAEKDQDAPETWAMRLLMADYLFTRGRYPEAEAIYGGLFKKYGAAPPEAIAEFYAQSCYKFSQMLIFLGREKDAIETYRKLLAIKGLDQGTVRQATFELAQLLVKRAGSEEKEAKAKTLAEAKGLVNKLFWKLDIWFGRSVALLAHMRVMEGSPDTAQKLVEEYMDQFDEIDAQLERQGAEQGVDLSPLSPVAECRYLIGTILADEADKALAENAKNPPKTPAAREKAEEKVAGMYYDAYVNLVNVYVNYPSYAWAMEAMDRTEKIAAELDKLGYEVEAQITPEQRDQIASKQFSTAASLYKQKQYEKSIETYESILRKYPETPESVQALLTLAKACTEFAGTQNGDPDGAWFWKARAAAAAGYLADRWSNKRRDEMTAAGDALRELAQYFLERGMPELSEKTLDDFLRLYPRHTMAARTLAAEAAKRAEADPPDWDGAIARYKTLVENYGATEESYRAHRRLADAYAKSGRRDLELDARSNYLARVTANKRPAEEILNADYAYARALRDRTIDELRAATVAWDEARRGVAPAAPAADLLDSGEAPAAPGDGDAGAEADPVKAAEARLVAANGAVGPVANRYAAIIKKLSDPEQRRKLDTNAEQTKLNSQILLVALYDRAYLLSSLNQPVSALGKYKKAAISTYEAIVKNFPEADTIPMVLLQLGTLYTTLPAETDEERAANAKSASKYFDLLAKDHPDSEQAKNALFLQGKALMELGARNEAIAKFREMITSPGGKYSAFQLQSAAKELFAAKEWALAEQGYSAAWAKTGDDDKALRASISIGRAEILFAQGKYVEAAAVLDDFIQKNPRSSRIVEANEMLCRACVQATLGEADSGEREKLFARAIKAARALRAYKRDARGELQVQLQIGSIIEAQAKVEEKFGNADRAMKYRRDAANHYQTQVISADRRNADIRPELESIFAKYVQALVAMETYTDGSTVWPDVRDTCGEYLELFPQGRHLSEVRQALSEANVRIATSGGEAQGGVSISSILSDDFGDVPGSGEGESAPDDSGN